MGVTDKEIEAARRRMKRMQGTKPMAVAAHYNKKMNRIIISLSSKVEIMFNPSDVQALESATPDQLAEIEVTPSGFGLFFPALEEGINVPNLIEGTTGTRSWMAARLGAEGGKARTKAKVAAARANGALGGRPRKSASR